eukprot:9486822-Pyramimonas_sp.AAC.1
MTARPLDEAPDFATILAPAGARVSSSERTPLASPGAVRRGPHQQDIHWRQYRSLELGKFM